jgi:hypothetical protein
MTTPKVHPVRLQRSRGKGARLVSPNGLPIVCVARPSRWGNQYRVRKTGARWGGVWVVMHSSLYVSESFATEEEAAKECVAMFRRALLAGLSDVTVEEVRRFLEGKNLACWCRLGAPCHADTLLCVARGIYS